MNGRIEDFTEREIRNAILNKADPERISKTGKPWKGSIFVDGILLCKVKIPNDHIMTMKPSKSQYIAQTLLLTPDQFNRFIECSINGSAYRRILKKKK